MDIAIAGENSQYMQLVRYNMQEYGLSYEAAGAAAMQTLWQNALYEGYAGAFAGGVSAVIATPFGLRRALKNTVDTMSNSSDISPQKQDLLKAMDDNMNENSIDIDAGDASFRGEDGTAMIISDDMADTDTQSAEDASVPSDGRISPPSDQDIINSIQGNIKNTDSAETMQTDLITGMSALIDIETRLKSDSGNINSQGIDISASHNAYMDFNTERGTIGDSPAKLAKLGEAAQVMARDIRTVVETGRLMGTEVNQLLGVLTGLTGDADLAETYVSSAMDVRENSMYNTIKGTTEGVEDIGNFNSNILIDTYKNMRINSDIIGQAHHLNQDERCNTKK